MNRLVKIIIAAVLIPLAIYLWPASLGGDAQILLVSGKSMYPTIQDGSLVITKESPPYEIGDIVGYYSKEARLNVVHRIIDVASNGDFVIKGDNNDNRDPGGVTTDDILGKVVFATPFIGQGLEMLRNPIVLLISAIVLIAIQSELKRRKKKKEKIQRILLGIPPPKHEEKNSTKPQKPNYSVFLMAMILNIVIYALLQISIVSQIQPKGDQVTGFLFKILEPSFASTVSFGLYSILILGLYYITKRSYHKAKYETKVSRKSSQSLELLLGKNFKPIPSLLQFLIIMYMIMAIFQLVTIGSAISPLLH